MIDRLQKEIRRTVELYCDEGAHREAILCALNRPGFALHAEASCRAGALAIHVNEAASGSPIDIVGTQAAAGVELFMQAAYMFDAVADQEVNPNLGSSPAEELALAVALLNCGAAAVCEAFHKASQAKPMISSLLRVYKNCISACAGQFLDAYLEKQIEATIEQALKMSTLKAGGIGRLAAGFGASIATGDARTINLCEEFGFNLFTYLQLIDDLRDACPDDYPPKDLIRHKKTVPLVYFYNWLTERPPVIESDIMLLQRWERASEEVRQEYQASGARAFGAIVAEAFLNRAKDNLGQLGSLLGTVNNLEHFVSSFEFKPQEVVAVR